MLLRLVMSGRELSENLVHTHGKETEIKMLGVNTKDVFPFFKNIFVNLHEYKVITERIIVTGRARLIRTWLILKVSLKFLPDSYHFMFKMHS